jgi:DNA polymerase III subunit delta'
MLYEKEADKQSLSIKQIREAIEAMSERPYEGKMLILFRDFDSASLEAMNASLKILEEPPAYAIILLIVSNPENIIETIRSRTLTFFRA